MTAIVPNEGEALIANMIFKNADVNRGTDLELGLFTNASGLGETTGLTDLTEPTGGNYERKTLTDANWTGSGDTRAYALQTFTATGSAYNLSVYGYFIATTGTSPKLLGFEIDPNGPYVMMENNAYDVTPTATV
jgi:hypothetical protein